MPTEVKNRPSSKRKSSKRAFHRRLAQRRETERSRICAETDRMFMWLMLIQWAAGIVVALAVSPRTWIGDTSYVHMHVYLAIFFGGVISIPPALLAWFYPGRMQTRITIAIAQAAWSCVLIQLTGGRIETHFHAFGSLAFLAFYREWRLLIINSVIVLLNHVVRGSLWPISVYGVAVDSHFRIFEHAVWLTFINIFLVKSCIQQLAAERRSCKRQAQLEHTNAVIEHRIERRTSELAETNEQLQSEFIEHRKTQKQRERAFRKLAEASRRAGMAEVATGVLHNVGNVLNSVNVSASLLKSASEKSRVSRLATASKIISEHEADLGEFLTNDERGRHFPTVLQQLTDGLLEENEQRQVELTSLLTNLEHMHKVIDFQQSFAKGTAVIEDVSICGLIDEALKINTVSEEHEERYRIERDFENIPLVRTDKHKAFQILINLISNASDSLIESDRDDAVMKISVEHSDKSVRIQVADNGVGIASDQIERIFGHGFTTKKNGHGFGLHSSALAAQALGGSLSAASQGLNRGATFTLTFPVLIGIPCTV